MWLQGDIHLATDQKNLAEECFNAAMAIATSQNALWWQLLAATSLLSLRPDQGNYRQSLESIASQFADHDQPDVTKAMQLLAQAL